MVKTGLIFCFCVTLTFVSTISLVAQTINSEKSHVLFEVGNMKFRTVDGSFGRMSGSVLFEPENLQKSYFNVCIDASTINTENKKRDDHLRSKDFFFIEKYPEICFVSQIINKTPKGYLAKGRLNLHGIVKEEEVAFTYSEKNFVGNLILNRLDYGVGEETGTFMVSDEVTIKIVCLLN